MAMRSRSFTHPQSWASSSPEKKGMSVAPKGAKLYVTSEHLNYIAAQDTFWIMNPRFEIESCLVKCDGWTAAEVNTKSILTDKFGHENELDKCCGTYTGLRKGNLCVGHFSGYYYYYLYNRIWGNDHILGIYRLYWGTLVPDDDCGKMTIY